MYVPTTPPSFKKIHRRKPEKMYCQFFFLCSCWRHKNRKNTDVFLWARADLLSFPHQRACNGKTTGSHLKLSKKDFYRPVHIIMWLLHTFSFRCLRICSSPSLLRSSLNELRKWSWKENWSTDHERGTKKKIWVSDRNRTLRIRRVPYPLSYENSWRTRSPCWCCQLQYY